VEKKSFTRRDDQYTDDEIFPEVDDLKVMIASDKQHVVKEKPCFWKFKYGKCTSPECKLDHTESAMVQMRDMRIKELAMSPYKPKQAELSNQFDRFAREGPQTKAGDKARGKA